MTPGPDELPPLPETSSVQSPTTSKGPPVQLPLPEPELPQLITIAHIRTRLTNDKSRTNLRFILISPLGRGEGKSHSAFAGILSCPCIVSNV